jgi:hypothetical protein
MPSKIIRTLNQAITSNFLAAEINAVARPFVAFSAERLNGQRVKIYGIVWSLYCGAAADRPNAGLEIILQRGLIVTASTSFPADENINQMMLHFIQDESSDLSGNIMPSAPLKLEPGDSYALYMNIVPRAAFVGNAILSLNVYGSYEAATIEETGVNL